MAKNLYEEARYSYGNSIYPFFNDRYIIENDIIDFCKVIDKNKPIRMLKLFLDELGNYHNFVHKKSMESVENSVDQISSIIKAKFEIQRNIGVEEK